MHDRQRLKDIFALALERPSDERAGFLRDECAGDGALRRELESLLAAYDDPRPVIERDDFAAASLFGARSNYEGKQFGQYRIVREIGRGGMGAVFLAERADGEFEQRVALKVVRRGFAEPDLARRFRRERQILATLGHENIARLLGGGVSEDGEPFFVMEHVEGARIDDYCDANRLPTDARLRLFLKVCDGVSYAHQRLVVHRDIKPSNIIVTDDGTPKLLDFGIAKLLDAERSGEETRTEHRAFTPEYASPEQSRGESVTTATDVFSLGRLLRNLLQGADSASARRRGGREGRPDGGARARTSATNLPTRAEDGGDARTHGKPFGSELRNIVAMATREEPDRRYPSAAALAEDVRRYLAGLPVGAQKDSFTYRAGKFVRRNRLPVAAAALVCLSLLGGAAAAAWQARVASERARLAAENQRRAEVEAARAKKITAFAERVLSYANPAWYAEGHKQRGQARVIDVLNDLGGIIETEFPGDPDIQAELSHKCAEIFLANQMFEPAERHARRALELRRRAHGDRHAEVAKDLYYLGAVMQWQGNFPEGLRLFREAAAMFREVAPDNANLPYVLEDLTTFLSDAPADLDEAERLLTESLELFRRRDGDAHHNTARLYLWLALNAAKKREFARADALLREGEARSAALTDEASRALPRRFSAEIEKEKGNYRIAEEALKRYAADARNLQGENKGSEESHAERLLLQIYDRERQWAKAVELARADAEAERKVSSETGHGYGRKLALLSLYLLRDGRAREGAIYFERARKSFGGTPSQQAQARLHLGECLLLLGRRDEALALLEEAREFYASNFNPTFRLLIEAEELVARARATKDEKR